MRPTRNILPWNGSTSLQYQVTPTIKIRVLVTADVVKEMLTGLNPTDGLVKCLIKRAELTKNTGLKNPKSAATYFGTTYT